MRFEWLSLRFEFKALERVVFPPVLAGNVLRGAMGVLSRSVACEATCTSAATCANRASCLYARVFEPVALGAGPSGLADHPRPFVFRARHLDGRTIVPGEEFGFGMNVFTLEPAVAHHLRDTFTLLEQHGLGPTRGKVRLLGMSGEDQVLGAELGDSAQVADTLKVQFVSPTELKAQGRSATKPDFPALFSRVRDRIATLSALYGAGPLEVDFRGMGERAGQVTMAACYIHTVDAARHSTRTGQTHPLGGFTGTAIYEGRLGEFVPWLQAAEATGVGRQAVWGKGEILVSGV